MPKKRKSKPVVRRDYAAEVRVILAEARRLAAELKQDPGTKRHLPPAPAVRFLKEDITGILVCRKAGDIDGVIVHAVNLGEALLACWTRDGIKKTYAAWEEKRKAADARISGKRSKRDERIQRIAKLFYAGETSVTELSKQTGIPRRTVHRYVEKLCHI